jgi:hypothetical protein
MGPMNAYKDMLDNVVSPINCVVMNHQNQLEQMANGAMWGGTKLEPTPITYRWSRHGCQAKCGNEPPFAQGIKSTHGRC